MNRTHIFKYLRAALMSAPLYLGMQANVEKLAAQQPQIPSLQVCNVPAVLQGSATVAIVARQGVGLSGKFTVQAPNGIQCDPNTGYPVGNLTISGISMNDSFVEGTVVSTLIEQLTVTGGTTPTAYLNGRCSVQTASGAPISGCRFWMMIANNNLASTAPSGTPDILSFLIFNKAGVRIAYGTGPVVSGHINVFPTSF
jgi:hypothetical protein